MELAITEKLTIRPKSKYTKFQARGFNPQAPGRKGTYFQSSSIQNSRGKPKIVAGDEIEFRKHIGRKQNPDGRHARLEKPKVWIWMAVSNKGDRVAVDLEISRLVLSAEIRIALRPNALFGLPKPRDVPIPNRHPQRKEIMEEKQKGWQG